jgi:Cft2 family RNA processing exonuclease
MGWQDCRCRYIKPADRDRLTTIEAFNAGVMFVVQQYHEKP